MKLQIERTLGIINAEIDLEPGRIVEVVGPNASGKTSIAVCAQAVLARESNPLGLSAADAKRSYPHDGADDARVVIGDRWDWIRHPRGIRHAALLELAEWGRTRPIQPRSGGPD